MRGGPLMPEHSERGHLHQARKASQSQTSQALRNLRAYAIVTVVSFHSVLAYLASQPAAPGPFDSPPYHWLATPILDGHRWLPFDIYAAFQYVALMPVMFFLSGIFVWPSIVRRGSWNFLYGRLLRIGLPFVFGVYLLMPIAYYRFIALPPPIRAGSLIGSIGPRCRSGLAARCG